MEIIGLALLIFIVFSAGFLTGENYTLKYVIIIPIITDTTGWL